MEELIKIAKIYYKTSSPGVKGAALNFFKAMDHDNDGTVCLHEFLGFMREEGPVKMSNHHFFKTLDRNGNGTLDFEEVMALYYIIHSGRPSCYGCDDFIPGMYFTCSKCYQSCQNAICLCPECYDNGTYTHEHNQFLDNYALLEVNRMQGIVTLSQQQHQGGAAFGGPVLSSTSIPYLPQKPDREECIRFMSTGICNYGSDCSFHHPRERIAQCTTKSLDPLGLPSRPVQPTSSVTITELPASTSQAVLIKPVSHHLKRKFAYEALNLAVEVANCATM